jgi:glutamate formiminotransferase / 5-formyltetrahydrofolate cyclo-ligase
VARKLFECVANVSEGRSAEVVAACAAAVRASGALLAGVSSDAAHHRSVLTYFGERAAVVAASVALARVTTERIDLRLHRGEHPRIGALDVLPFVPFGAASLADAVATAHEAAAAIWAATGTPAYFYGAAATRSEHAGLPAVRAGQFEGLAARAARGIVPDVGDVALHPSAGAIAVGARELLIAFNVVLRSGDLALARGIARRVRERDGGLRTLRAIGVRLSPDRVQVSCNLTDHLALPLDRVAALVARLAARAGVAVEGGELIGLVPRVSLAAVAARRLGLAGPAAVLDG